MLFPLTVLWVSVTAPLAKIPPPLAPSPAVLFPLTVLWVSVTVPWAKIPPPLAKSPVVLLPLTVLWSSVRLPVVSERIAPPRPAEPLAVVLPPVSVSPPRVKSPVVAVMLKIRDSSLASIVTFAASGRASITSASLIASSVPPSVIVCPGKRGGERDLVGACGGVRRLDRFAERDAVAARCGDQCRDRRDVAVDHVVRVADRDIGQQPPVFQQLEPQPPPKRLPLRRSLL